MLHGTLVPGFANGLAHTASAGNPITLEMGAEYPGIIPVLVTGGISHSCPNVFSPRVLASCSMTYKLPVEAEPAAW